MADTPVESLPIPRPVCYLIDKLAVETRVQIYQHVFGSAEKVQLLKSSSFGSPDPAKPGPTKQVNTSLLATNRFIYNEALETSYSSKTVRLRFPQLARLLEQKDFVELVRKIEIVMSSEDDERSRQILKRTLSICSRLKSPMVIFVDQISRTQTPQHHAAVRDFMIFAKLGRVTCIDIGRYELNDKIFAGRVCVEYERLRKMWPSVANTPLDYNPFDELDRLHYQWGLEKNDRSEGPSMNFVAWSCHTSLRLWVGMHEQIMTDMRRGSGLLQASDAMTTSARSLGQEEFVLTALSRKPDIPFSLRGTDSGSVPLRLLAPRHDPMTLESATELLAWNINAYEMFNVCGEYEVARPRWAELGEGSRGAEAAARMWKWDMSDLESPDEDSDDEYIDDKGSDDVGSDDEGADEPRW